MALLISFLILLLNLVILGVIFWGLSTVIGLCAKWLGEAAPVLQTIVKVICVIIGVVWIAGWLIGFLGGGGFSVPMFYQRSLRG